MPSGEALPYHPAEGKPDKSCALDAQMIHQVECIVSQQFQLIWVR